MLVALTLNHGFANDLRNNGYSLIPAPQKTELTGKKIFLDHTWSIDSKLNANNPAIKRLHLGMMELYGIQLTGKGKKKIILVIESKTINKNLSPELAEQAYILKITPEWIKITANTEMGLFYGVQSLLQLLKPEKGGNFSLPEGTITDWPDLKLRIIHWDTKHHQDKIETLKRHLDWAAYFKVNAVAFEIEDKFEFPSHPVIGAPGAFTLAEMQEITAYAQQRYIKIIPMVQAPSHMAYVLKHKEFEHLKSDGNNYQICMCDEEAMQLIFDLYQDMIDATPGVDYFLVSTDEIYYAGICGKCKNEFNNKNRSQAWVDYVKRVNPWMTERNRKMISWIEYPLLPEDIHQLPSNMIDGVISNGKKQIWIDEENKAGIEQLIYNSIQGAEYLFPNYFPTEYRDKQIEGNLKSTSVSSANVLERGANLIGSFTAAWDDAGLHNDLFWLGWATGIQYSWTVGKPSIEQSTADFMNIFYGYDSPDMVEIYRLLEDGARFYQDLWDNVISKERKSGYGNSYGKDVGIERFDLTLEILPKPDINLKPEFRNKYAEKIEKAIVVKRDNEKLISLLMHSFSRIDHNQYNVEVMLSIAYLEQYTINTLLNWVQIESYLIEASKAKNEYSKTINNMVEAYNLAGKILKDKELVEKSLKLTWEKSRFEKCRSANGKDFIHVLDDVKDHFADRRLDINYMLAPFERMEVEKWQDKLMKEINMLAKTHHIKIEGINEKPLNE